MTETSEDAVWWGVWCEQRGTGACHWHGTHDGSGDDTQTTQTEAKRIAGALNEFAHDRTDSLGWTYEARPYVSPKESK